MKKVLQRSLMAVIAIFLLSSCAAGHENFSMEPAGFWMGLWHGFITLFTFIISLFKENVNIYEVNNTGWPYNLGFIFGVAIFFGGSGKGSCRR